MNQVTLARLVDRFDGTSAALLIAGTPASDEPSRQVHRSLQLGDRAGRLPAAGQQGCFAGRSWRDSRPNRVWVLQNRSREFDAAKRLPAYTASWTRSFEPLDENANSLFANSSGRIIQLSLLQR